MHPRVDEVTLELQRDVQFSNRLVPLVHLLQNQGEVAMGFGERVVERNRSALCDRRLLVALLCAIDLAEVGIEMGGPGVQKDRLLDQREGLIVLFSLMQEHAQQVERIGMPRLLRQQLAIHMLGLIELAMLMELESCIEELTR